MAASSRGSRLGQRKRRLGRAARRTMEALALTCAGLLVAGWVAGALWLVTAPFWLALDVLQAFANS